MLCLCILLVATKVIVSQIWNKPLASSNQLDGTTVSDLIQGWSNKTDSRNITILLWACVLDLVPTDPYQRC